MPSSAATSHSRSPNSAEDLIRPSRKRYSSSTPSQSTPDMVGVQKSRRSSLPNSAYACAHSAAGSAENRARDRSTVIASSDEPLSTFRSDGTTRTLWSSPTTSRAPSPLTANQLTSEVSTLASRLRRSKRSRTGFGRSSSRSATPSPSSPATG